MDGIAKIAGRSAREVVRIDSVIKEVARLGVDADAFPDALTDRLSARSKDDFVAAMDR